MACQLSLTKHKNIIMKNLSLILLLILASLSDAVAQSMIKVHLTDNTMINISVDGRYFSKKGTSITVGDLPPGRHLINIYTLQQDRRGRGHEESIYSGKVNTHAGYIAFLTYDPGTDQTDIQEQDINTYTQNTPAANNGGGNNVQPGQVNNNNNDYGNDNKYIPSGPVASPVPTGTLTDAKTDNLKQSVAAKKTDTEKMNTLKDGLNGEKITTDQVSVMMDWFNFEATKVDFAKWAYPNTVDKENFISLENKLSYKNYQDDLDKFIKDNSK